MATLVRGATRWLSSALHLGGAPGRKFSNALTEERAAMFHLLEAYNDHVEARAPFTSAAVRPALTMQKKAPHVGFSIDSMLMQEVLLNNSALDLGCSKLSAWEQEQQAPATLPKKYFAVKNGKATLVEED